MVSASTAWRVAVAVPPEVEVLTPFVDAGVFGPFEVQLAATLTRLQPDLTDEVVLALAVAARAPRFGHVCVELHNLADQMADLDESAAQSAALPWPAPDTWVESLARSALVSTPDLAPDHLRPLVWDGTRLYLQRYWRHEVAVAGDLNRRASLRAASEQEGSDRLTAAVATALDALFGPEDDRYPDLQRLAALRAQMPGISVIAGGPGTGKTHTVARLLAVAHMVAAAEGRNLSVALAAPTGKAAQQMKEAVRAEVPALEEAGIVGASVVQSLADADATTIHRLLGWRPGPRFDHDRRNPLLHQLVVVDETSMVSLPLMAQLLDAVRPEARVVLVGDPYQLASIEAGTVLADVVGPAADPGSPAADGRRPERSALSGRVTVLRRMHRFGSDSAIAALAEAVRVGDADAALALLEGGHRELRWVDGRDRSAVDGVLDEAVEAGVDLVTSALRGDAVGSLAAAVRIKVLAATRRRPGGLYDWSERIERGVGARVPELESARRWYIGRPVIVTGNDRINQVANGDVAVVVGHEGAMRAAFRGEEGVRYLAPSRLDQVETWWAMTIHKSQGSEFPHAVVSLPPAGSPILTRQLLYTAVTRARTRLTMVGSEEALRAAIHRPVTRASGLRDRLWPT